MPSAKQPAKSPAKAPAKPAAKPAKAAPKAAPSKAPAKPSAPTGKPAMGTTKPAPATDAKPVGKVPPRAGKPIGMEKTEGVPTRLERVEGRDTLCQIEIVKDGHFFIARTATDAGQKEYKNTVFEDLLTEMVITLQEQLVDK